LLDALIGHLEGIRDEGARWVHVTPGVIEEALAPVTRAPSSRVPSTPVAPARVPAASASLPASAPSPGRGGPVRAGDSWQPGKASTAPPRPVIDGPILDRAAKLAAMEPLKAKAASCVQCAAIARARRSVVFGEGDVDASLMLVGEAPGREEDQQGEPFVGAAGQLLTKILVAMGLGRDRVFIANVLKCRPDTPGESHGNRRPTAEEMATCIPFLFEQVRIVRPKVIVALGGTALEGLLGQQNLSVTRLRGRWMDFVGIPLMPTYHPSYVLRQDTLGVKREVWEDMLSVMERLGMDISAKQRAYFTKA
jgi:DNA polymerase